VPESGGPDRTPLLEVGRIVRPHGLRGEVVVDLWTDLVERLARGTVLDTDRGPLTVTASRPFQERFLVQLEGIDDRPSADGWRGVVLRAPAVERPGTLWVHELVGSELVTEAGEVVGRVAAVEPNPASDLLVLEDGALVPLRFVLRQDPDRRLVVELPEGLLDLGRAGS
jgi:16S rRNA processing protein RimM